MTDQQMQDYREWYEMEVAPKLASAQTAEEVIASTDAGPIPAQSEGRGAD